jgi:organic hydroperoxide reductase OsmC/OhrA
MDADHRFAASLVWTGNRGTGTSGTRDFGRDHVVSVDGKPDLHASAARVFHGDRDRWNPEEELIAALSGCHLMSYLYVAVAHGIVVESYRDAAEGVLTTTAEGGGRFTEVVLRPVVTISAGDPDLAQRLHAEANRLCFIASSVNFPVRHEPTTTVDQPPRSSGVEVESSAP